jgi:hypothetical protein
MLREDELLEMADTYRDMAKRALAVTLRNEFDERAARFEAAATTIRRHRSPAPPPKPEK